MQTKNNHWPSILILVMLGISAAFIFLISALAGIRSLIDLFSKGIDPAGEMIGAVAYGFELLVLCVCGWVVFQKASGRPQADLSFSPRFSDWQIAAVLVSAIVSVALGSAVIYTEITWLAWIILPVLTLIVIVPPLWMFFGLGTRGIEFGPRWQIFGIFGLAMTIGPLIMIVLELVLLVTIIVLGAVAIATLRPDLLQELVTVSRVINQTTDPDKVLSLVAPYLSNTAVIAMLIAYIGLFVPLIEELLKPLGVWLFVRKIESPAQGFALGVISGAAFALIESLNAGGNGTMQWPLIVSVRAGTSLLHMTASGLVGWGIASAFREKRYLRLPTAYLCAVFIHGLWNSCAIGLGISVLGETIGKPEWMTAYIPSLVAGMSVLAVGMFIVLIASNRRLRSKPAPIPQVVSPQNEEKVQ